MTERDDNAVFDAARDLPYERSYLNRGNNPAGRDGERMDLTAETFSVTKPETSDAIKLFRRAINDISERMGERLNPLLDNVTDFLNGISNLSTVRDQAGVPYGTKLITEMASTSFLQGLALFQKEMKELQETPHITQLRIEICASHPHENPATTFSTAVNLIESGVSDIQEKLKAQQSMRRIEGPVDPSYEQFVSERGPIKEIKDYEVFKAAVLSDAMLTKAAITAPCEAIAEGFSACRDFVALVNGLKAVGDKVLLVKAGRGQIPEVQSQLRSLTELKAALLEDRTSATKPNLSVSA